MRTADATRDTGPSRSGSPCSEAAAGGEPPPSGKNLCKDPKPNASTARKSLALCSQPELVERARAGDRYALDTLVEDCKPAIIAAVSQHEKWLNRLGCHISADLYQEGRLAVLIALQNYDSSRARGKFSSYAEYSIKKYVRIAAKKLSRPESVSANLIEQSSNLAGRERAESDPDTFARGGAACLPDDTSGALSPVNYSEADPEADGSGGYASEAVGHSASVARYAGAEHTARLPPYVLYVLPTAGHALPVGDVEQPPRPYSLELPGTYAGGEHPQADREITHKDLIVDENAPDPADVGELQDRGADSDIIRAEIVHAALGNLEETERVAVVSRYGLGTECGLTVKETATRMGMRESALKDLLARAKGKLSMRLAVDMLALDIGDDPYGSTDDRDLLQSA